MKRAGCIRRFIAYVLDSLITLLALTPFWIWFFSGLFSEKSGIYLLGYSALIPLLWGLFQFFYFSLCWSINGQTVGMKALSIRLLSSSDDGRIPFLRSTVRCLGMLITLATFGLGFLLCLVTRDKRTVQDYAAGTYMIIDKRELSGPS